VVDPGTGKDGATARSTTCSITARMVLLTEELVQGRSGRARRKATEVEDVDRLRSHDPFTAGVDTAARSRRGTAAARGCGCGPAAWSSRWRQCVPSPLEHAARASCIRPVRPWRPHSKGGKPGLTERSNLLFGYLNRNLTRSSTSRDRSRQPGRTGKSGPGPADAFPAAAESLRVSRQRAEGLRREEIVWTLTSKGKTEKAYGSLSPNYVIDTLLIMKTVGASGPER